MTIVWFWVANHKMASTSDRQIVFYAIYQFGWDIVQLDVLQIDSNNIGFLYHIFSKFGAHLYDCVISQKKWKGMIIVYLFFARASSMGRDFTQDFYVDIPSLRKSGTIVPKWGEPHLWNLLQHSLGKFQLSI